MPHDVWPAGWTHRCPRPDDIEAIVATYNARSQRFFGENQSTRIDVESRWNAPRFNPATDAHMVLDDGGAVAGIVEVGNPGEPFTTFGCSAVTHPRYEEEAWLWDWLNHWALERARKFMTDAAPGLRIVAASGTLAGDRVRRSALERAGFAVVRAAYRMRIDLTAPVPAPQWPDGVLLRTIDADRDLEELAHAFIETWRDHWGYVERPLENVVEELRYDIKREGDRFDPTLWLVAAAGNRIAGMAICSGHIADDCTRGYIASLGVRPAWRRRGIGLALLREAFGEFQQRGYVAVELGTDSENLTGALRLYTRAGMHPIRQTVHYEKLLRDGVDLATRALPT